MAMGYVIPVDPSELANRFSAEADDILDRIDRGGAPEEDDDEDDFVSILSGEHFEETITPLLDRIPEREADLIYLYYIQKKRQADIAEIFGVTQAAISYRLVRGLKRIKFLLSIPSITEQEIRRDLPAIFKPIDVDILVGMWATTCQSEVANTLGLTQGRVRHRFFKAVATLTEAAKENKKFSPYQKVFHAISSKNFNVLREVRLPQWQGRGGDACL